MNKIPEIEVILKKYKNGEISRDDAFKSIMNVVKHYQLNDNVSITEDIKVKYEFVSANKK